MAEISLTLQEMLFNSSSRHPNNRLFFFDGNNTEVETYSGFVDRIKVRAASLIQEGYTCGDVVSILMHDGIDKLVTIWGCIFLGIVPIIIPNHDMSEGGNDKEVLLQHARSNGGATKEIVFSGFKELPFVNEVNFFSGLPTDVVMALMTSGSSGLPKIVPLTHKNIISRIVGNQRRRPLNHQSKTLNWMPLDHVGGLVMFHLRDVYYGCEQVHLLHTIVKDNPILWLEKLSEFESNVTWASNASLADLLVALQRHEALTETELNFDLSALEYLMNGGEPIDAKVMLDLGTHLRRFGFAAEAIVPGWGMTETSGGIIDIPIDSLDNPKTLFSSYYVGRPQLGNEVRIVDENRMVVVAGKVGNIEVRGQSVVDSYIFPKDSSLIDDESGWFSTGDRGYISSGGLYVLGRNSDAVSLANDDVYLSEVEQAVEARNIVPPGGVVAIVVENSIIACCDTTLHSLSFLESEVPKIIAAVANVNNILVKKCMREEIPRTSIGKVNRVALAKMLKEN